MKNERYKGWTNYPTYAVHQWLTNENDLYFYFRELTEPIKEMIDFDPNGKTYTLTFEIEDKINDLSLAIKEFVDNNYPLHSGCIPLHSGCYGFYGDIGKVNYYDLEQVNYFEIAENMIEG